MKSLFPPRYFLASVILLSAITALFAGSTALQTQREFSRQLEEKGLALAEALETSSRNAISSQALVEEMIGQRLLDNARLVDQLLLSRPPDSEWLRRISAANGLTRIELLDQEGRPWTPPAPPAGMPPMMGRRAFAGRDAEERRAMMMYVWGRRWAPPPPAESVPTAIRDRTFWEGSTFGVAVGARSFPGIIAVHADANYVLRFGKEIGIQRQMEELGRQAGVVSIALLDENLEALAHSRPDRVGQRESDPALQKALETRQVLTRLARPDGGAQVYEIVKPLTLEGGRAGLLKIALSTDSLDRLWQNHRRAAVVLALAALGLGVLGLAAIFYTQHRHLAEVKTLEAEMERRESLSALGNMAAAVAHEIRNPLNAVSMGLQRLSVEFSPAEGEEYRRLLELVQGEVRRLNTIVEEFLSLARPLSLKPEPIQVSGLMDEVVRLVEAEAGASSIRIERAVPAALPTLEADRDRLKQVVLNLTLNAIQAMPQGGALTLGAAVTDGGLALTVTDSGAGIPPELMPRVFDPYVTTKTKGLGLGLTIARRIVEAHGGRVAVESQPGRGTCFRVTLPLHGARRE
jgi:signal transduction histidine kinase